MSAQVAIASQYFPAYARIPRKAQRKADEFIRKFQQDPKQASIHYEPIGGASDKQLRSVRVGDDYRAIVRAPEKGNLFILLYIDHHDEAYRWAEGKQLRVHPATGTLQFFDVDEASAALTSLSDESDENDDESPNYEEKRLFSEFTDEQLFLGGVPQMLLPAVRALYTDSDLDRLVPHLPREAADLLTGLASGYQYDEVVESILDAPSPSEPPPSKEKRAPRVDLSAVETPADDQQIEESLKKESSQAQFRLIDENFDLDKALSYPLDAWRVYLHPSQRKIVRALTKGPLRITGGAGTGKTVVAMHRAAWLLKNVFTSPDDRILVTTFTKTLAHDIENNLEKLLEPQDLARVEVANIDAWAFDYLKHVGHPMRLAVRDHKEESWQSAFDLYGVDGFDLSFCKAEWNAVIQAQGIREESEYVRAVRHHRGAPLARADRRKLWELFLEYRSGLEESGVAEGVDVIRAARTRLEESGQPPRYRSVIVDETQDLSGEALKLIRALAGPERANDLLLVGDAHQRIYGLPIPLSQCGINIRGRRSRELRLNYRTTAAICRWSLRTLGDAEYDDLDAGTSTTHGYVSLRKGASPVVRHFDNRSEEHHFLIEQIRNLLGSGLLPEEICIVARTNKLLSDSYAPALKKAGIDCEILDSQHTRSSTVRLATMHRVKGLEFPAVFVVAVNDGFVPLSTPDLSSKDPLVAAQAEQQDRCLLYVATSRARDQLFVTSYERKSPFLIGLDVPAQAAAPTVRREVVPRTASNDDVSGTGQDPAPPPSASTSAFTDSTPVSSWNLPTRMQNWLSRHDVHTVGELIALNPKDLLSEKNLGRKSVSSTAEKIEQKLGAKWEVLRGREVPEQIEKPVPVELSAVLEQPLDELPFPVRFFTWANKQKLVTLRDLASWQPLKVVREPKMGRGTVAEARAILEQMTGRRWEEVHRQLAQGKLEPVKLEWETLSEILSDEGKKSALTDVPLPAPMRMFVERRSLKTVSDLIEVPQVQLLAEAGLNERVASVSYEALVRHSERATEQVKKWESGFLASLKEHLVELDTIPRMIISRRAGLGLPPETLEEIGATLGITRERVRQIEKKTWEKVQSSRAYCTFVEARCTDAAPSGAVSLDSLDENNWWKGLSDEPDALDYFCDRLLDGRWGVVRIESERYLSTTPQKELDQARIAAKRIAKKMSLPLPLATCRSEVLAQAGKLPPGVQDIVWEEIEEGLSTDGQGDALRVVAFGHTKNSQILAYLEQRGEPVPVGELIENVGRIGNLPEEIFLLARGVVGLERHFPNFQEWRAKLAPLAIRLIQENGPERQWSCTDLLPTIREEEELPDWLEHWHLAAILRRSEGIEYLGRLRVALPGVIEDSARIFVHHATEELLKKAGGPLSWDELTDQLRKKLDVSDIALVGILNKSPFIKVARKAYGLVTRDLPGGVEAMSEAWDELEGVLERRQRGLASRFVQREIAKLSAVHSEWTEEMCLSVARSDPRFRNAVAGVGVGLSEWDTVRIPSRLDLIREAMENSPGRVSVEAVSAQVESIYGVSPTRLQIGAIANRFGGRLDGDWIEKGEQ